MNAVKILVIDDDDLRPILIKKSLENYIDSLDSSLSDFGSYFKGREIIHLKLESQLAEMTSAILRENPDCVLIDYRLNSEGSVDYDGVDLSESILTSTHNLPLFILTAYEDDLFRNSSFSAYQVYDIEGLLPDPCANKSSISNCSTHCELQKKIIKQAVNYRRDISLLMEELGELLKKERCARTVADDSRILEIDSILEHSLDSKHALSDKMKRDLVSSNFEELIEKIDILLEARTNG